MTSVAQTRAHPDSHTATSRSLDGNALSAIAQTVRKVLSYRRGQGAEPVDDMVQITLLRLLEKQTHFEGRSSIETFAIGIAKNVRRESAVRASRRSALEARFAREHADAPTPVFDELSVEHDHQAVTAAMNQLPLRDRWLLEARLAEDVSYAELLPRYHATFDRKIDTVEGLRTAFFYARRRLVALLGRERLKR